MILRDLFEKRARVFPGAAPANAPGWLVNLFGGGGTSASGFDVSEETAMNYSAVYSAFRILGESVASLPLKVMRRTPAGKDVARSHWAFPLLHDAPNPEMTAFTWRELGMTHLCAWGNAFSEIEWNPGNGAARAFWPIHPRRVAVRRLPPEAGGGIVYDVEPDPATDPRHRQGRVTLPAEDMLHVPALGWNGLLGLGPIRLARESIGLGQATERFGAGFFGNGSQPGGILSTPAGLDKKQRASIREAWEEMHQGAGRDHRVGVLGGGMTWTTTTIPPEDAQFLETRKFQVSEIARWFRIPPHMLADLERATFANIEHQSLEFVMHTLRPWLVRWEQEFARKLFNTTSTTGYYASHNVSGLLRGDQKTRYEGFSLGRQWGWFSIDDIREMEELNPLPDGLGASYLTPMNMTVLGEEKPDPPPPAPSPFPFQPKAPEPMPEAEPEEEEPEEDPDLAAAVDSPEVDPEEDEDDEPAPFPPAKRSLLFACEQMTFAAYDRFARRESKAVGRIVARGRARCGDPNGLIDEAAKFYDEAEGRLARDLLDLQVAFADVWTDDAAAEARAYCKASLDQIEDCLSADDPFDAVDRRLTEWTQTRPAVAARRFAPAEEVA